MKRYGGLWEQVLRWDNLLLAARKAQRGKRYRPVVGRFNFHQEWHLLRLQRELREDRYCPGAFTSHWIDRPKRRLISAAPYRDRVVHHAILNVLEPLLDRHFHPRSYACRKGITLAGNFLNTNPTRKRGPPSLTRRVGENHSRWSNKGTHARQANSEHLLERLSEDWVFTRAEKPLSHGRGSARHHPSWTDS